MLVAVPRERREGETRVALTAEAVSRLVDDTLSVVVENGAGQASGCGDDDYTEAGASIASSATDLMERADVVVCVNRPEGDLAAAITPKHSVLGMVSPLTEMDGITALASTTGTLFAMELVPRTSRAQSMDALSSMSTVAGYRAVLLAALELPRFFPMLMTAAGTVPPAKVLVIGAGVAGLQAIATARRLGAVVSAYDTRPVVREQVESLGAKFIELDVTEDGEGQGGYARALTDEEQARQRELMADHIAAHDVVITTALVPGRPAPLLIPTAAVERMRPGSVIVDLASVAGGNCEVTRHGETVEHSGVHVMGPSNLPATMASHASQLYAKNVSNLLALMRAEDGSFEPNFDDDIVAGCCVARASEIIHPLVRERLGLPALELATASEASS